MHGSGKQVLENVVCWSREYLDGFIEAIILGSDQSGWAMLNVLHWRPPNEGFYKLNTDAALNERNRWVGLAMVIQIGWVMVSSAQKVVSAYSPQMAELQSILVYCRWLLNLMPWGGEFVHANSIAIEDIGLIV